MNEKYKFSYIFKNTTVCECLFKNAKITGKYMALTAFFRLQNKNVFDVLDIYKTALLQRTLKKNFKVRNFFKVRCDKAREKRNYLRN